MKSRKHGFTLMELMVVIVIVGLLAAAVVPILRGKIDRSKWAEANAAAGMIARAAKVYFAESGVAVTGPLSDVATQNALGIQAGDLAGTYFSAGDYAITAVNDAGDATVTVTGSRDNAPDGTRTLTPDGTWQ